MYRHQVELDKTNIDQLQEEIKGMQVRIQNDKKTMDGHRRTYAQKAEAVSEYAKRLKNTKGLTEENLKRLGVGTKIDAIDEDALTEFSVLTAESELLPQENVLDLRISEMEFNATHINKILGMKDAAPAAVQTFATVSFFDHPAHNTDLSTGYKPDVSTIISFKNVVDDFYLTQLRTEHILVEVFIIKGSPVVAG